LSQVLLFQSSKSSNSLLLKYKSLEKQSELLTAWYNENSINGKEPGKNEKLSSAIYDLFLDYTEYSTIQGLIYIFFSYQTILGRIFWSLILILMFTLGVIWCKQAYDNWKQNPVLTTITTTAFPSDEV
jgi:hypothetical protein